MLAAANLPVIGQIKFPKIPKIGPVLPAQVPTPSSGEQPTNTLQTKGGNYIDDGFTWFEAVSTKDPEIKQTNVYTGWALKSSIRLMGIYPARSAFKIVVSKAGKPVATTRCEAYGYNIPAANPADVSFINADRCWKATSATKDTGNFDVEIIAINGDTDAETSVRKYKIDVLRIDRISGPTTQPVADSPRYVISRHAEAPVSILFLRPAKAFGYLLAGEAQRTANINQVEILYSISPSDVGKNVPNSSLRCSVDGKRLQMQALCLMPTRRSATPNANMRKFTATV